MSIAQGRPTSVCRYGSPCSTDRPVRAREKPAPGWCSERRRALAVESELAPSTRDRPPSRGARRLPSRDRFSYLAPLSSDPPESSPKDRLKDQEIWRIVCESD